MVDRAASRIASFSVAAKPPIVVSTPSMVVADCHHHSRLSSVGAARRPIMILVSETNSMPTGAG